MTEIFRRDRLLLVAGVLVLAMSGHAAETSYPTWVAEAQNYVPTEYWAGDIYSYDPDTRTAWVAAYYGKDHFTNRPGSAFEPGILFSVQLKDVGDGAFALELGEIRDRRRDEYPRSEVADRQRELLDALDRQRVTLPPQTEPCMISGWPGMGDERNAVDVVGYRDGAMLVEGPEGRGWVAASRLVARSFDDRQDRTLRQSPHLDASVHLGILDDVAGASPPGPRNILEVFACSADWALVRTDDARVGWWHHPGVEAVTTR